MTRDPLAPWRGQAQFDVAGLVSPVAVACSGGPDSVALLALACDAGLDPIAVHVDHGLQPERAGDAAIVHDIATRLGAAFRSESVTLDGGGNLEARAREARYLALERARGAVAASFVLLGHTQDDQAETIVLNFLRGAAGPGLAGMARQRGVFVRPLLGMRRADTHAICSALDLPVVRDAMNDDAAFRRVAVRRDVLPLLAGVAGRDLVPVLARQADVMREESQFLDDLATAAWPGTRGASAVDLSVLPPVLAQHAVRCWLGPPPPSRAEVQRILGVARGIARATELAGGRVVTRAGGQLRVGPR